MTQAARFLLAVLLALAAAACGDETEPGNPGGTTATSGATTTGATAPTTATSGTTATTQQPY